MLAKVVIAKADGNFLMLVLPADHRVDFERLKSALGLGEVRLAQEAEFRDLFPGCEVGAMPPFGNLYGVPVHVDRALEKDEEIVFNAGTHTLTAKMRFRDFAALVKPVVAEFAVHL
jgi:Ala-tRNA(Pro) deacylase